MPDIFRVFSRRWKTALLITLLATLVALVACFISPKEYVGEVTALPSNPETGDRARIFNPNIDALYRELGGPDDLDRIEGTARLDTIFLAVAKRFRLQAGPDVLALHKAAKRLQKATRIYRTGYGELKIKVWNKDPQRAAALANALVQELNAIHQRLQAENNRLVLQRLKETYAALQNNEDRRTENLAQPGHAFAQAALYARLISEYELALQTNPNALLIVEPARPAPRPDRPQTLLVVTFTFLASLLFSALLLLLTESRRKNP